jgi:hypothetical protein
MERSSGSVSEEKFNFNRNMMIHSKGFSKRQIFSESQRELNCLYQIEDAG